MSNAELAGLIDTSDDWIYSRTGIKQRHIAAPNQTVTDLPLCAATQGLAHAGCAARDLDLILVATATPQESAPSTACRLQCRLNAPGVPAFDLMAACSGFLYGVHIAAGVVRSGLHRRVLAMESTRMSFAWSVILAIPAMAGALRRALDGGRLEVHAFSSDRGGDHPHRAGLGGPPCANAACQPKSRSSVSGWS